ncbi:cell wall-binding repeat-containing protein [Herbiconiux sp.]|uniref:cell wall-binding repeat-containing protein n=1 Tax=Herbiconiux sp. TaxID=1871186 RepID=UPI0025C54E90|nr:cell wall-binding repeat-containing protein [Herbiconiux sp.]
MRIHIRAVLRRRSVLCTLAVALAALLPVAAQLGSPTGAVASGVELTPAVSRIAGADRYEEAVLISQRANPGGTDTVFLASGASFADALSAVPVASVYGASLLLTPSSGLIPSGVVSEIIRLRPGTVTAVGGPASVPDAALEQVRAILPRTSVSRISGADRYAVSRAIAGTLLPSAPGAMIATGRDFPDALSAGAAAGASFVPLVLVDGAAPTPDTATLDLLSTYKLSGFALIGGPASISAGVESAITGLARPVRILGSDRYQVSIAVNDRLPGDFSTVYLATGVTFPDALAGGVLAGQHRSPLYVVPPDCVPKGVLAALSSHGTSRVILLGGVASLNDAVASLTACSW